MPATLSPPTLMPRYTMVPRNVMVMGAAALIFAVTAGGLWAAPASGYGRSDTLVGTVRIVGSRKAALPVSYWASILQRDHPGVRVITMLYGAGTGAGALAEGEADLVPIFRTFRPDERAMIAATSVSPYAVEIGSRSETAKPMMLYFTHGSNLPKDRIAAELVHIAQSPEGRAAITNLP